MVNKPASSARPRKASSSSLVCCGNSHCGLGSAQPLRASARFTVVAKSSMPIMVPSKRRRAGCVWRFGLMYLVGSLCSRLVALSLHGDDSCVWGFVIAARRARNLSGF